LVCAASDDDLGFVRVKLQIVQLKLMMKCRIEGLLMQTRSRARVHGYVEMSVVSELGFEYHEKW
jgi:hypothetical protein